MAILREYQCDLCGLISESFSPLDHAIHYETQEIDEEKFVVTEACSGRFERIMSAPEMFILHGEGFFGRSKDHK